MQKYVPLILILLLAFAVRLYKLDSPLADWHSWRQVDTASVSREFATHGFDLLHPRFHDVSNVPSGEDNPQGYRFVEFPIYNMFHAAVFLLFPFISLEGWGRILTAFSSTIATLFLYLITKKHADRWTGFLTGFFFALLPFNVYFGRTILPDPSMVMASLGGIYFFDSWIEKSVKYSVLSIKYWGLYSLAVLFTASALLLKPYALFFLLPMIVIAWQAFTYKIFTKWQLWVFVIVTVIPLIWWRLWMMQYPEGIPASDWLLNAGNIRFKGAFFYWLFADRMGRLILGYWGMGLFILGILANSASHQLKKQGMFFYSFFLSALLYMTVIARGNVQHDYYQILIIPSMSLFLGIGAKFLLFPPKEYFHPFLSRAVFFIMTVFMIGFGWYFVRDFYNINNPSILIAGEAVDALTPSDAKVVAPYDGDTTLLYYTKRSGWASFENPLPELITKGATHLVLINPAEKDLEIGKTYKIIKYTKEYILFDLRQKINY